MEEMSGIDIALTVLSIIGGSGLLTAVLPPAKASMAYAAIKVILNLAGANWGAARNEHKDIEVIQKKRGTRRPGSR